MRPKKPSPNRIKGLQILFEEWKIIKKKKKKKKGPRFSFRGNECVPVTIGNPAFCLPLYLAGVLFRGKLQQVGDVSKQTKSSVDQSVREE